MAFATWVGKEEGTRNQSIDIDFTVLINSSPQTTQHCANFSTHWDLGDSGKSWILNCIRQINLLAFMKRKSLKKKPSPDTFLSRLFQESSPNVTHPNCKRILLQNKGGSPEGFFKILRHAHHSQSGTQWSPARGCDAPAVPWNAFFIHSHSCKYWPAP